uniref:Phytanoyl-CoA dioxygenase n=2 Tax=Lotharella globosa TaxID=91324 RepID=A0A7S3YM64_9EUKA
MAVAIATASEALRTRGEIERIRTKLQQTEQELAEYTKLVPRAGNAPWIYDHMKRFDEMSAEAGGLAKEGGYRANESVKNGLTIERWEAHLDQSTPRAFQSSISGETEVNCWDLADISLTPSELENMGAKSRKKAALALKECGFLVLDSLLPKEQIQRMRDAYNTFRETKRAEKYFRYPCQGKGRFEYMLPFEPPFNSSNAPYHNPQLRSIILDFLGGPFKLELMTVINSSPGSGDQRWHQGWRYLFHGEERLPPYSIVVGIPLADVSSEMGPTQFCPRRKLRFYHGFRCDEGEVLGIGSTSGSVILFDYKLLHRGPANDSPFFRPMISMVFSRMFFVNAEAYVNRGISLLQTLHQRRFHLSMDDSLRTTEVHSTCQLTNYRSFVSV